MLSNCLVADLQAVVIAQWLHPCIIWYVLQWAERLLEGGGNEQWGDKWEERFKDGSGGKQVCRRHFLQAIQSLLCWLRCCCIILQC